MIYRRFGFLQSRLLLQKQEQLRRLEHRLDMLDEQDEKAKPRDLVCMDAAERGKAQERTRLMQDIETKFREYGMTSLALSEHRADLKKPP